MSLDLSQFARSNREATNTNDSTSNRKSREEAKFWLNFGYIKAFKNEQGEDDQVFVTLARGIAVDQIDQFDLDRVRNSNMATLRRDQNRFLDAIMAEANKLEPGTSKFLCFDEKHNLGVELRRVGEAAKPHEEDTDAPLPFSFG